MCNLSVKGFFSREKGRIIDTNLQNISNQTFVLCLEKDAILSNTAVNLPLLNALTLVWIFIIVVFVDALFKYLICPLRR